VFVTPSGKSKIRWNTALSGTTTKQSGLTHRDGKNLEGLCLISSPVL